MTLLLLFGGAGTPAVTTPIALYSRNTSGGAPALSSSGGTPVLSTSGGTGEIDTTGGTPTISTQGPTG